MLSSWLRDILVSPHRLDDYIEQIMPPMYNVHYFLSSNEDLSTEQPIRAALAEENGWRIKHEGEPQHLVKLY